MWYTNNYRRHLCDMHIDDWNDEFLKNFSPEEYFENLKQANVQNAMLYFQSHVGLCHYPTKSGKMHRAFTNKENAMKHLAEMCRKNNIRVTGYYSLIYNNWAHDTYPEWRMLTQNGLSKRSSSQNEKTHFSELDVCRYGMCCPNNENYRNFVSEQIKEICEYFEFDGMFFDMLFWPHPCYCPSCQKRWKEEVGGELPRIENWKDPKWLLHIEKRRQWMGEFAAFAANELKKWKPDASVEHNVAFAALPDAKKGLAEEVLRASDYAGGDIGGSLYNQSFICKFYRNVTKNQPFEHMLYRCEPNLSKHTVTKSEDHLLSTVMLTAAHHGATLLIDAIDVSGTLDSRIYKRIGNIFSFQEKYEKYFEGQMKEDIGIYYSLRSKYNAHNEKYCNHNSCINTVQTMITENICCGITGSFHSLDTYQILIAPSLTETDFSDYQRIVEYVANGGQLYISGNDCHFLLKKFFNAVSIGRTKEKIVYISPNPKAFNSFDYFNSDYPLHFDGSAPIVSGISPEKIIATITLPYTPQDILEFASIHSNPPGPSTNIPAMAVTEYGKGRVFWSSLPIEEIEMYDYRRIFMNLLRTFFKFEPSIKSDAPKDVEITLFETPKVSYINTVLLNNDYHARKVEAFTIAVKYPSMPQSVQYALNNKPIPFEYENGYTIFKVEHLPIFEMYKIIHKI